MGEHHDLSTPGDVVEHGRKAVDLGGVHRLHRIVDDEEPIRIVASEALRLLGVTPLEAGNGSEALELFQRHRDAIDLVLLDLTMPVMNGEETLRQLRTINPTLRVVLMSGYSEGETMQRCSSLGVSGYLPKPFELGSLVERLRPYLS